MTSSSGYICSPLLFRLRKQFSFAVSQHDSGHVAAELLLPVDNPPGLGKSPRPPAVPSVGATLSTYHELSCESQYGPQ